jgi:hypothetical protein
MGQRTRADLKGGNQMRLAAIALMVALATPSHAEDVEKLKERWIESMAMATVMTYQLMESKCSVLKINLDAAGHIDDLLQMDAASMRPGGKDWPMVMKYADQARKNFKDIDPNTLCRMAKLMFGRDGTRWKNLLVPPE